MSGEGHVQCYNKGCAKKFDPADNGPESCTYHPGPPYFHDAYKIWNCCNKKSTDFGTWLGFPGCTKGKHNPEKPEDIVKVSAVREIRPEREEDVIVWNGLNQPAERKADDERKEEPLRVEVTAGATAAIQRYREQNVSTAVSDLEVGAPCRNHSCKRTYPGAGKEVPPCQHHPGIAVFHEGMKYWSCCKRKTTDFGAFLDQNGCAEGEHNWSRNEKVDKLREDFFSANGNITINAYCKGALPDTVQAASDGQMLRVNFQHGFGAMETELSYDLWGEITPADSFVRVGERKVEIILKQADNVSWPRLRYEVERLAGEESNKEAS